MHELTDRELYQSLEYAKGIDEETGRKIIERFELDQTALAQMIFGIFPSRRYCRGKSRNVLSIYGSVF